ncbi:MAG TPA: DnaA/Hda family protein [Alphaproteobacteria bacterium]
MNGVQLALDLGHRPALGRDDFLVAGCNRDAVAWLDRWPDWPAGGLAIVGPAGCGKSHLAGVWRAASGAPALALSDLDDADPIAALGGAAACVIDDADGGVAGTPREQALLHLYNHLRELGGQLLLTGRTPPARWPIGLADLRSRLAALPAVAVGMPDEPLIAAVLVKLFADRQLRVGQDVIMFLVPRIERSFEAARQVVARIDRAALASARPVTTRLVRDVLAESRG